MLTRVRIKGYKSFHDVEVRLSPLSVMFGPNAAGKSNLLDALQLLARLGTSRTVKEAFDAPCRGKPLESFTIEETGIRGLVEQERLTFSIEADLHLSDVRGRGRQSRDSRNAPSRRRRTRPENAEQGPRPGARARSSLPHRGGDASADRGSCVSPTSIWLH